MLVPWVGWAGNLSVLQQLEQEASIKTLTGCLEGLVSEQSLEEPWFTESQALVSCKCVYGPPRWLSGKEPACQCGRCGCHLWIGKIALEKEMATPPVFFLAWETPWTEEPRRLSSIGLRKSRT